MRDLGQSCVSQCFRTSRCSARSVIGIVDARTAGPSSGRDTCAENGVPSALGRLRATPPPPEVLVSDRVGTARRGGSQCSAAAWPRTSEGAGCCPRTGGPPGCSARVAPHRRCQSRWRHPPGGHPKGGRWLCPPRRWGAGALWGVRGPVSCTWEETPVPIAHGNGVTGSPDGWNPSGRRGLAFSQHLPPGPPWAPATAQGCLAPHSVGCWQDGHGGRDRGPGRPVPLRARVCVACALPLLPVPRAVFGVHWAHQVGVCL